MPPVDQVDSLWGCRVRLLLELAESARCEDERHTDEQDESEKLMKNFPVGDFLEADRCNHENGPNNHEPSCRTAEKCVHDNSVLEVFEGGAPD